MPNIYTGPWCDIKKYNIPILIYASFFVPSFILEHSSWKKEHPESKIVIHPECTNDVVKTADAVGSTEFIRKYVEKMPDGTIIGVGTEINMVKRLDAMNPTKKVVCPFHENLSEIFFVGEV